MQPVSPLGQTARKQLRRLLAVFLAVVLATGLVLWALETSVSRVATDAEDLTGREVPTLKALSELRTAIGERQIALYEFAETADVDTYRRVDGDLRRQLKRRLVNLEGLGWPASEVRLLQSGIDEFDTHSAHAVDEILGRRQLSTHLYGDLSAARGATDAQRRLVTGWSERVEAEVSAGGRQTLSEIDKLSTLLRRFSAVVLILLGFVLYAYYGRLRDADERGRLAVFPERNPAPVMRVDSLGTVEYANPAALALVKRLGLPSADALVPESLKERLRAAEANGAVTIEALIGGRDFEVVTHYLPESARHHVYLEDITARKEAERLLIQQAFHDEVTSLPNRRSLEERVAEMVSPVGRPERFALLQLTLDRFAMITGTYGHAFGDHLLQVVSSWLLQCLATCGERVLLYRFSGASWVIVLAGDADAPRATALAERLLELSAAHLECDGRELTVPCSIGATLFPDDGRTPEMLLRNVDAALRAARDAGVRLHFYTEEMNREAEAWLQVEQGLRHGLEASQFELFYQPKVDAASHTVRGSEALIRWRRDGRIVAPGEFINVAEESGLIVALGDWVLERACRQWVEWQAAGLPALGVAVNVSAPQFQRPDFPERVARVLAQTGMPARQLELEITEAVAASRPRQVIETMTALKQQGVSLAIDDFGTGYSSLSYLTRFPIDTLKIDQSFVRRMIDNPESEAIVRMIINLARELHFKLVAEGVETAAEAERLAAWSCDLLQGYHFAKPMPAADFAAWVRARG